MKGSVMVWRSSRDKHLTSAGKESRSDAPVKQYVGEVLSARFNADAAFIWIKERPSPFRLDTEWLNAAVKPSDLIGRAVVIEVTNPNHDFLASVSSIDDAEAAPTPRNYYKRPSNTPC